MLARATMDCSARRGGQAAGTRPGKIDSAGAAFPAKPRCGAAMQAEPEALLAAREPVDALLADPATAAAGQSAIGSTWAAADQSLQALATHGFL